MIIYVTLEVLKSWTSLNLNCTDCIDFNYGLIFLNFICWWYTFPWRLAAGKHLLPWADLFSWLLWTVKKEHLLVGWLISLAVVNRQENSIYLSAG